MSKAELAALYTIIVARAKANLNDTFNEFHSRYRDAASTELLEELHKRTNETLELLVPSIDIPSGR